MSDKSTKQIDKFKELAREIEAEDDEGAFERALRKIAPKPPSYKPRGNEE